MIVRATRIPDQVAVLRCPRCGAFGGRVLENGKVEGDRRCDHDAPLRRDRKRRRPEQYL